MAELRTTLALDISAALRDVERLRAEANRIGPVDVDFDAPDLSVATGQARQLDAAVEDVGEGLEEAEQGGIRLGAALKGAIAAIGVREALQGLKALVDAASDLEESTSKAGVVFGDSFETVAEAADQSAVAVGLAEQQYLEAAGTLGNLFVSQGLATEAAADMSVEIVQLAADLASFNNIGTDEALEKLRAGLVGEVEPLRTVGVALNAAQVEAKALELGLVGLDGQLSESAKVQARYALILEQSTTAQGDFARTSDGLANQQRILAAEAGNAAAQLGQALLPLALELVDSLRGDLLPTAIELGEVALPLLVEGFEVLSPLLGITTQIVGQLAGPLGGVLAVIEAIPAPLLTAGAAFVTFNRGLNNLSILSRPGPAGLAARVGLVAAASGLLAETLLDINDLAPEIDLDALTEQVEGLGEALSTGGVIEDVDELAKVIAGLDEIIDPGIGGRLLGFADFAVGLFGVDTALDTTREGLLAVDAALASLVSSGRTEAARQAFDRIAAAAATQGVHINDLRRNLPEYETALGDASRAAAEAVGPNDEVANAVGRVAGSASEAILRLDEYANAIRLTDPVFRFAEAQQRVIDALEAFRSDGPPTREEIADLTSALADAAEAGTAAGANVGELPPEIAKVAEQFGIVANEIEIIAGGVADIAEDADEFQDALLIDREIDVRLTNVLDQIDQIGQGTTLPVDADTTRAEDDLIELARLANAFNLAITVGADTRPAEVDIGRLEGDTIELDVDADTSAARRAINALIEDVAGNPIFFVPGGGRIPLNAAQGAIVEPTPGGQLFRVGEAGVREVIVPVDNEARAVGLLERAGLGNLLGSRAPLVGEVTVIGAMDPDVTATRTADELAALALRLS